MKVLVLGAGGAASNGFARALHMAGHQTVGANSNPDDLLLSACSENHPIAHASDRKAWLSDVLDLLVGCKADLIHAQNDGEVEALTLFRSTIHMTGCRTFLPSALSVKACQDKWLSYQAWRDADVPVPRTDLVTNPDVLLRELEAREPRWLRPRKGAGGQRSLKTNSFEMARDWVRGDFGVFTIAECLTPRTVTVQQVWWKGELICSQQRSRASWANAGSTTTGVSGSTGVGVTSSDQRADEVANAAVAAIDPEPHGIWGVDMAYDDFGIPNVTEINIGRFFTTVPEFYARAGFNIAAVYADLAAGRYTPDVAAATKGRNNPIADGVRWIRGMDSEPVLVGLRAGAEYRVTCINPCAT